MLTLLIAFARQSAPADFNDLMAKMSAAYHSLTNYTDTWEMSGPLVGNQSLRFVRRIDGKKSWLRVSTAKSATEDDPLVEEGTNGREQFIVLFHKSEFYAAKDDGMFLSDEQLKADSGSLLIAVSNMNMLVLSKPALELKRIETIPNQVVNARIATAEVTNPDTKNKLTVEMSFFNRWWLLSDLTATIHFADGTEAVSKLHPTNLMMNAKLPQNAFDLDLKKIKGFAKKTRDEILKDVVETKSGT